jgi:uncharacterized Tic20 family protein
MDKLTIAKKIIHYRKLKGMTQETLSEMCGLNVRTIQRIESGEVDARLYTLKSIAEALEVNLEELLPTPSQHELNQIALLHITPVGFFIFPIIGNVLLPFIFWMLKKEEVNGINKQGKDILNSQLTYSILMSIFFGVQISIAFMPLFFPENQFVHKFLMNLPIYILIGMILSAVVFGLWPAINAIRAYNGKEPWKYPFKIVFFK